MNVFVAYSCSKRHASSRDRSASSSKMFIDCICLYVEIIARGGVVE